MNPAAALRRGIGPAPPLPAPGVWSTFGQVWFNGPSQGCRSKGLQIIRCHKTRSKSWSNSGRDGFPLANAKMAVESLLCFSLDTAVEPETIRINTEKKKALQILLSGNNSKDAERVMTNLLNDFKNEKGSALKYEATLAVIQILIHIGTIETLRSAIDHLNDIGALAAAEHLPSDTRVHFYRAVIYTLLEKIGDAQNYWRIYTRAVGSGPRRS